MEKAVIGGEEVGLLVVLVSHFSSSSPFTTL
jgi:hypothetical protein